jgi:hypothetical protein
MQYSAVARAEQGICSGFVKFFLHAVSGVLRLADEHALTLVFFPIHRTAASSIQLFLPQPA